MIEVLVGVVDETRSEWFSLCAALAMSKLLDMDATLRCGARVRVKRDPKFGPGPWPAEPSGVLIAGPDGKAFSEVGTTSGLRRMYWVHFDEPQLDADGPYESSQVLDMYVELE